ncbi:hypothetical protein CGRA01v4_08495 [Colletotrichum graminicola]|nr:hypothetical protein CGRA01v4_08495 [Colletotrichum graminicola]
MQTTYDGSHLLDIGGFGQPQARQTRRSMMNYPHKTRPLGPPLATVPTSVAPSTAIAGRHCKPQVLILRF